MIASPKEIHDGLIYKQVNDHYNEALTLFPDSRIVGLFLQGSQNYGLDYEGSDVDTKLIVVPTFEDIVFNRKPVSTTHIRTNEEHIDLKDLRLYFQTFVKQNLNFLEILFTNYAVVNSRYKDQWNILFNNRELIAHMNPHRAVKSMKGIAIEKYHAMEHEYPSKINTINKFGYDGKQVHHLLRVEDYLRRYIAGESYADCLRPLPQIVDKLMAYKKQMVPLDIARKEADESIERIVLMAEDFCSKNKDEVNPEAQEILNKVQYEIMRRAIADEFKYDEVYN